MYKNDKKKQNFYSEDGMEKHVHINQGQDNKCYTNFSGGQITV